MGLLFPEDPHFDENERQTGFYRYRQILSVRFGQWWKTNLLTLVGLTPLAAGIFYSVASASVLVLLPCSTAGGMIAGPFLAGMYDAILRGLRDDPCPWWDSYRSAWRQNWKDSLIPGALFGLVAGVYTFMAMLFWWSEQAPTPGTIAMYLFALLLMLIIHTLYWPQLVLFRQKASIRLRNCLLFCAKYLWRVLGVGILQLGYLAIMVLFAPWTLILIPILGVWYIWFLAQFLIYDQMNEVFEIEQQFDKCQNRN